MITDDFNLQRFVDAQASVYDDAVGILRAGAMCAPYMDFIFPRLRDEGSGDQPFAMVSLDEARAYLALPLLGNRYRECVEALSWLASRAPADVFGFEDSGKLCASLTLFAEASTEPVLRLMLSVWFDGRVDEQTIVRLSQASG